MHYVEECLHSRISYCSGKIYFEMNKIYLKLRINLLPTIRKIWKESKTGMSFLTSLLIALQILPISVDGHKVGDLPIIWYQQNFAFSLN